MTAEDFRDDRSVRLKRSFLDGLSSLWEALFASRIVLFAILIIFYLLHSGQGEELIASLTLVSTYNSWLMFASIFAWAAQSWLWSSLAISLAVKDSLQWANGSGPDLTRRIAPLIFAAAVFGVAVEPLILAERAGVVSLIGVASLSMFGGIAAWFYLDERNDASARSAQTSQLQKYLVSSFAFLLDAQGAEEKQQIAQWSTAILASLCWSALGLGAGIIFTLGVGSALGTVGTVFFATSLLLPLGAAASIATRRTRIPILIILSLAPFLLPAIYNRLIFSNWAAGCVCLLLIFYAVGNLLRRKPFTAAGACAVSILLGGIVYYGAGIQLGVPHEIRVSGTSGASPTKCLGADQSVCSHKMSVEVDRWLDRLGGTEAGQKKYVVFVSAAGGGLRAGYWTASILARLYDCVPNFGQRVFAISGVSGGSLGAGLYAALVRDAQANQDTSPLSANCTDRPINVLDAPLPKRSMQSKLTDFLENDFLAPVVASLFFRDLPQSLIPIQFMTDRAAILEKAFERAWRTACASRVYGAGCLDPDQFERSFFEVRVSPGWIPVLFLNGTHQETGKRVITSQVRIDQESFFDAFDFFDLVRRDVSLSTAVLNSARFPFVSPAGALTRPRTTSAGPLEMTGSIIDGGFFENNGATTLQEVVSATLKHLNVREPLVDWRPLVIEITNDVEIDQADLSRHTNEIFKLPVDVPLPIAINPEQGIEIANQLLSTAKGLYATRGARGIFASKVLSDFIVEEKHGELVQFRLCPHMRPSPPLGWLLTAESRNAMDQLILGHGRAEYQRRYAYNLTGGDLAEYKGCFDEIQLGLSAVRQHLSQQ
jgi:Patatin-like phospholipase